MNSKPFIIPKAPISQIKYNDLASILTMQPKNLHQFDEIQKVAFNDDDSMK
jgi:hypothetical protein